MPSELTTWLDGGGGVHEPMVESESVPAIAVLVLDVGGVDGERVFALGGREARQAADGIGRGRARDERDRDATINQIDPTRRRSKSKCRSQAAGVDRLAEGDVDGRDGSSFAGWARRRRSR